MHRLLLLRSLFLRGLLGCCFLLCHQNSTPLRCLDVCTTFGIAEFTSRGKFCLPDCAAGEGWTTSRERAFGVQNVRTQVCRPRLRSILLPRSESDADRVDRCGTLPIDSCLGSTPFPRTGELRVSPPAAEPSVSVADEDCASIRCSQRYRLWPRLWSGSAAGLRALV